MVHGGPATASIQLRLDWEDRYFYPTLQFLAQGCLILKPNYRGSDGRGHAFLELSHGNLGRGELWDVESGVDYLIEQGYVDAEHVGCAGWSYGGFVAAYLTTHSDRFAAVSVGAGITNWITYHATSDFHRFPEKVLGGLPHTIPEIYQQASPATAESIKRTPTLLQHGDADSMLISQTPKNCIANLRLRMSRGTFPLSEHGARRAQRGATSCPSSDVTKLEVVLSPSSRTTSRLGSST